LECANLLALYYFYQSGDKSPHSKEAPEIGGPMGPILEI